MRTFPRWMTWLFLLFLGYILMVGNFRAPAPEPERAAPTQPASNAPAAEKSYPALIAATDGERWKKAIYPDYENPDDACRPAPVGEGELPPHAILMKEGEGEGAACGDTIGLTLVRWGNDGKAGKPVALALTLGEQGGFDALLRGMRVGEERLLATRLPERVKALPLPAKTQLLLQVVRNH
jgi:hypothetical protein